MSAAAAQGGGGGGGGRGGGANKEDDRDNDDKAPPPPLNLEFDLFRRHLTNHEYDIFELFDIATLVAVSHVSTFFHTLSLGNTSIPKISLWEKLYRLAAEAKAVAVVVVVAVESGPNNPITATSSAAPLTCGGGSGGGRVPIDLQSRLLKRQQWASEITPGLLWLGSGTHAADLSELQKRRIARILNVADDVENFHQHDGGGGGGLHVITYENLSVSDFGQDKGIARVFPRAFEFLSKANEERAPVLVNCAAGANRSATVVIAWLMYSQSLSLLAAWGKVKQIKKGVCPMKDNRLQLLRFERELRCGKSSFITDEEFLTLR